MTKESTTHKGTNGTSTEAPVIVKKYANRRLYDTLTSSYITLEDLCEMVKRDINFIVLDAKTEEDLTRQILTQIIFEQESKGYSLLPVKFLRSIISFYGGKMQQFLPPYLEASMESFVHNQDQMRDYISGAMRFSPFTQLEEIGKQNMAFFQNAFSMFKPFGETPAETPPSKPSPTGKK